MGESYRPSVAETSDLIVDLLCLKNKVAEFSLIQVNTKAHVFNFCLIGVRFLEL